MTRGNTILLADQQMAYNISDRHMRSSPGLVDRDGTIITYTRDATGRVIFRTPDNHPRRSRRTMRGVPQRQSSGILQEYLRAQLGDSARVASSENSAEPGRIRLTHAEPADQPPSQTSHGPRPDQR